MTFPRRIRSRVRFASSLGLFAALFALGCGPGDDNTLTGTVTLDGAPVTGGQITLHPQQSGAPDINGLIDATKGTFSIQHVPAGVYQVGISPAFTTTTGYENAPPEAQGKKPAATGGIPGTPMDIPQKYRNPATSDFTWDVKKDGLKKDIPLKKS
jgi:hypothetical protein